MIDIPIILASSSPSRLELLKKIRVIPSLILPANIDESPQPKELPNHLASRLSKQKAFAIAKEINAGIIIAADSVVAVGRRILPKALSAEDIRSCLELLSGRRHKIYTSVTIIKKLNTEIVIKEKLVQSIIKFKRITNQEMQFYCSLDEGLNKAGGYSINGYCEAFITFISGSHSNVVGLPLFETVNMLNALGVDTKSLTPSLALTS